MHAQWLRIKPILPLQAKIKSAVTPKTVVQNSKLCLKQTARTSNMVWSNAYFHNIDHLLKYVACISWNAISKISSKLARTDKSIRHQGLSVIKNIWSWKYEIKPIHKSKDKNNNMIPKISTVFVFKIWQKNWIDWARIIAVNVKSLLKQNKQKCDWTHLFDIVRSHKVSHRSHCFHWKLIKNCSCQ